MTSHLQVSTSAGPDAFTAWLKRRIAVIAGAKRLKICPVPVIKTVGDASADVTHIIYPFDWEINAEFKKFPNITAARFKAEHQDLAFSSLANLKQGRPVLFREETKVIEAIGDTAAEIIDSICGQGDTLADIMRFNAQIFAKRAEAKRKKTDKLCAL